MQKPASFRDFGNASFSTSGGARNAVSYMNPLSPGGMNPKNTSIPTIVWALLFVAVAFILYTRVIKR